MKFTVKIANVNISVVSLFDEVFDLCKDYLTQDEPDLCIQTTREDIDFERDKAKREAEFERRAFFDFPDSYLETLSVYRKIADNLLQFDSFVMHGAVIGLGDAAYLFTAPSGVGKTTHINFWLQAFPDAFVINGDKPVLRFENGTVFACGTPWAGKEGLNKNVSLPLKSVCLLTRSEKNEIAPVGFNDIFPFLIGQSYRPKAAQAINKTLQLIKKLGQSTNFYLLKCNMDPNAAKVAFEGMNA